MNGQNIGPIYAFGPFLFDPARRILRRDTNDILLPDRISQLLLLLIQANGTVVDKETVIARVWPEGPPRDGNLSQHVYMLRQLLDEFAHDRAYVITVRRRGYRLAVPIRIIMSDAAVASAQSYLSAGDALLRSGLDAFHHFGLGCHLLEQQTATSLTDASHHFEEALQLDADYIPALVGLARTYMSLAELVRSRATRVCASETGHDAHSGARPFERFGARHPFEHLPLLRLELG